MLSITLRGVCADAALSRYVILPYPDKPAINGKSLLIASGFQAFWAGSGCSILKPPSDPPMLLEPVDVRVGIAEPFLQHVRSEEHTSELQSLMRISYAVFCLKKKKRKITNNTNYQHTTPNLNHYTQSTHTRTSYHQ